MADHLKTAILLDFKNFDMEYSAPFIASDRVTIERNPRNVLKQCGFDKARIKELSAFTIGDLWASQLLACKLHAIRLVFVHRSGAKHFKTITVGSKYHLDENIIIGINRAYHGYASITIDAGAQSLTDAGGFNPSC